MRYLPWRLIWLWALAAVLGCESPPTSPFLSAPEARAGGDVRAQVRETVVLDGSDSITRNKGDLRYAWVQVSGPTPVGIQAADGPRAVIVPPVAGLYVFRLTVVDSQGLSDADEVGVLVAERPEENPGPGAQTNAPPQVQVGRDQQVQVRERVELDGSGSADPEGGDLRYAWVQVSGPASLPIQGADTPRAAVVPPAAGEYVFRLTVTDSGGLSATAEMRVRANAAAPGSGTLRISATPVGPQVARVEYAIAAASQDTLRGELVVTEDGVASKTVLGLKAGSERLVEIYAYDAQGRMVAFGQALVQVEEGRTAQVEIALRALPQRGAIEVEAVFGDPQPGSGG